MPNMRHKIEAEELLDGGEGKLDKESLGEEVFCERRTGDGLAKSYCDRIVERVRPLRRNGTSGNVRGRGYDRGEGGRYGSMPPARDIGSDLESPNLSGRYGVQPLAREIGNGSEPPNASGRYGTEPLAREIGHGQAPPNERGAPSSVRETIKGNSRTLAPPSAAMTGHTPANGDNSNKVLDDTRQNIAEEWKQPGRLHRKCAYVPAADDLPTATHPLGGSDQWEGLRAPRLNNGMEVTGATTNIHRRENKTRRVRRQEDQGPQQYLNTHEGRFKLPSNLPDPVPHLKNMCLSGLAVHHPAYAKLLQYATGGGPVKTG